MIDRVLRSAGCVLLTVVALLGCSNDDGAPADEFDVPEPFLYASVQEPYAKGDVAACKAFEAPIDANLTEAQKARRDCLCDAVSPAGVPCVDLMRECDALEGCQEIRNCGSRTGCNNPNSCYLVLGLCRREIDKWGNGSVSTSISNELQACGCPP